MNVEILGVIPGMLSCRLLIRWNSSMNCCAQLDVSPKNGQGYDGWQSPTVSVGPPGQHVSTLIFFRSPPRPKDCAVTCTDPVRPVATRPFNGRTPTQEPKAGAQGRSPRQEPKDGRVVTKAQGRHWLSKTGLSNPGASCLHRPGSNPG